MLQISNCYQDHQGANQASPVILWACGPVALWPCRSLCPYGPMGLQPVMVYRKRLISYTIMIRLEDLHIELIPHNVCSALMGIKAGCALHSLLRKHISWLSCCCIVGYVTCVIVDMTAPGPVTPIIGTLVLLLPVLIGLCQRLSTLKSLVCELIVWYYVLFILMLFTSSAWIFGPQFWTVNGNVDALRAGGFLLWQTMEASSFVVLQERPYVHIDKVF